MLLGGIQKRVAMGCKWQFWCVPSDSHILMCSVVRILCTVAVTLCVLWCVSNLGIHRTSDSVCYVWGSMTVEATGGVVSYSQQEGRERERERGSSLLSKVAFVDSKRRVFDIQCCCFPYYHGDCIAQQPFFKLVCTLKMKVICMRSRKQSISIHLIQQII